MLGEVKQSYPCETCGLETEGYYGEPELTIDEQQEHLNALWEEKHHPRMLSPLEASVAEVAKKYGRHRVLAILKVVSELPTDQQEVIKILESLKGIK